MLRYNSSYTSSMKTAISIPDQLFHQAERLAGQLGISRSELYQLAVASFLEVHLAEAVTAALDAVHGEKPELAHSIDPVTQELQARSITSSRW